MNCRTYQSGEAVMSIVWVQLKARIACHREVKNLKNYGVGNPGSPFLTRLGIYVWRTTREEEKEEK